MQSIDRRDVVGGTLFALSASAAAAEDGPENSSGVLSGQQAVIIGADNDVAAAISAHIIKAGGRAQRLMPTAATEASYSDTLKGLADRTDIIVNVAIPEHNGAVGKASANDFHRVMEASYVRTFLAMKYGLPLLRSAGGGSFITVTSSAGRRGAPGAAAASAAANGIMQMTKCAALNCADKQDKVRVNAILAGAVTPDSIASAAVFLAADASVYYTGARMPVDDGGLL